MEKILTLLRRPTILMILMIPTLIRRPTIPMILTITTNTLNPMEIMMIPTITNPNTMIPTIIITTLDTTKDTINTKVNLDVLDAPALTPTPFVQKILTLELLVMIITPVPLMMSVIMDVAKEYQKWDLVAMEIYVLQMICVIMDIAWEHLWFAPLQLI
jgi:hypothetical protein